MSETDETRGPDPSPRELQILIELERHGIPFVYWFDGARALKTLVLGEARTRVTIGRREQSDIPLIWDSEVSRAHALLEPVGGEWTLVDDGLSRNGSYVSGHRVHGRRRLHDRERMCFGKTHVIFREPASAASSTSTARAPGSPRGIPITETQKRVLVALCRPVYLHHSIPATNPQVALEVHLSVDAVKAHLRLLFDRFGLSELPQNEKRSRLVAIVLDSGLLEAHDF